MPTGHDASARWADAVTAAALFAVDPAGTGGVAVRAPAGVPRERWLATLRDTLLPDGTPQRRLPPNIADGRLLGGLDLAATLRAGRPIAERGALADCDGGIALLAMAERWAAATIARVVAAMDARKISLERDGLALDAPARFGVVALDEGIDDDERPAEALLDRLAFRIDLDGLRMQELKRDEAVPDRAAVEAARQRLQHVQAEAGLVDAICATAMALGIASLRAASLCLNTARAAAALAGRDTVGEEDAVLACRLVLSPRATVLPQVEPPPDQEQASKEPAESSAESETSPPPTDAADNVDEAPSFDPQKALEEIVLEAARAAIPQGLLERIRAQSATMSRVRSSGKAGTWQKSATRGRPAGVQAGEPRAGVRLDVIATLRAAAPWQTVRRREREAVTGPRRIEIRKEDFRVPRLRQRSETATIFVVDASGSSALNRLAEAKGAVELLLADCYVRRDRVAVIAFRGAGAELLLPPTRSLVRAKRALAGLPGGGGTPLAAGIDSAVALADSVHRRGELPTLVLLTDGSANVARDGSGGRAKAAQDATAAARALRIAGFRALFVDTSPRAQPQAAQLAQEMAALYIALPHADAASLSSAVRAASV